MNCNEKEGLLNEEALNKNQRLLLTDERLYRKLDTEKGTLQAVWLALRSGLFDRGIKNVPKLLPQLEQAQFSLQQDPFDGGESLLGVWRDASGTKQGEIQIRADSGIYAEVDVLQNHPTDKRWFVESITAWGACHDIKTELRLLHSV